MSEKLPYQYEEKPASLLISRRTFLKVTGVLVSVLAIGAYTVTDFVKKRNKYIKMRQKGLYKDDLRCQKNNLPAAHLNPTVEKFYKDFAEHPLSETAHHLLHTHHYYVRGKLNINGGNYG